ncbi:hypothetical protein ACFWZ6_13575 [Streptomyces massasporeus]
MTAEGDQGASVVADLHAELFGDPGRGQGGIVVQELRDARREQITGAWSPTPAGRPPPTLPGRRGLGVWSRTTWRASARPAHEHQEFAYGRILLPTVPAEGSIPLNAAAS